MDSDTEQLSELERAQIKGNLHVFMMEHPARPPRFVRILDWMSTSVMTAGTFIALPRARLAGALVLALVFVGAGTSYAAESALPGDALYSVKINVNEKIAAALAPNPSARATVFAAHTLRRLQEAETLAAQGRLSTSTSAGIELALQGASTDFDANVKVVAHSTGGAAAAADLQSNLEVTLNSHARALALIQSTSPHSDESLAPILAAVVAHAAHAREAEVEQSGMISATTSPSDARKVAGTERESAKAALSQVRTLAAEVKETFGTTSAEAVTQHALDAEQAVNEGEKNMREGDTGRATSAFRSAIRTVVQTQTDADTAAHLKKILPGLSAASATDGETKASEDSGRHSGF